MNSTNNEHLSTNIRALITYHHNNAIDIGVDIEIVRKSLEKPIKYLALIPKLVQQCPTGICNSTN